MTARQPTEATLRQRVEWLRAQADFIKTDSPSHGWYAEVYRDDADLLEALAARADEAEQTVGRIASYELASEDAASALSAFRRLRGEARHALAALRSRTDEERP